MQSRAVFCAFSSVAETVRGGKAFPSRGRCRTRVRRMRWSANLCCSLMAEQTGLVIRHCHGVMEKKRCHLIRRLTPPASLRGEANGFGRKRHRREKAFFTPFRAAFLRKSGRGCCKLHGKHEGCLYPKIPLPSAQRRIGRNAAKNRDTPAKRTNNGVGKQDFQAGANPVRQIHLLPGNSMAENLSISI